MKVAVISGFAVETPPRSYGGLEAIAYYRAEAYRRLGHEVTLIASMGSKAPKKVDLMEVVYPSFSIDAERKAFEKYAEYLGEFDLIDDETHLKLAVKPMSDIGKRVIAVYHDFMPPSPPPPENAKVFGVSNFHADMLSIRYSMPFNYIYNCVSLDKYRPSFRKENYYLWMNRVSKGALLFVRLCNMNKWECIVAGDDNMMHGIDPSYRDAVIRECSKGNCWYMGGVDEKTKKELIGKARATIGIFEPSYWEVFGIWMIESMAMATPVISFDRGSMREVLPSEWVVHTIRELREKAENLSEEDEKKAMERASEFSCKNMPKWIKEKIFG